MTVTLAISAGMFWGFERQVRKVVNPELEAQHFNS